LLLWDRQATVNDALLFVLLAAVIAVAVYGTIRWLRKNRDDQIQHRDEHRR
jgi:putative copper export protein